MPGLLKKPFYSVIYCSKKRFSTDAKIKLKTEGPWLYHETITRNAANKLDATIADMFPFGKFIENRQNGEALPYAYHLLYFNPENPEHSLDPDGYESQQSPGAEFTRRMWLGGSMEFRPLKPLKIGSDALAIETLHGSRNVTKKSQDRVIVTLDRKMGHLDQSDETDMLAEKLNSDWSIRETRALLYFTEKSGKYQFPTKVLKPPSEAAESHKLRVSQTALFRYSALTFNAHKIHYDKMYAIQTEGLSNTLVHGPLTVTLMLAWMQNQIIPPNRDIESIKYKNQLPIFVDEEITLACKPVSDEAYKVWIENSQGMCAVEAKLHLY